MTLRVAQIPRRFVQDEWGGTETVVLETSKRLLSLGHQTEILCPIALSDKSSDSIQGVPVKRYPYFYPYLGLSAEKKHLLDKKAGNLVSFPLLKALIEMKDLDLIHLHTVMRLGGIGRVAAKRLGIPYVVTLHGGFHEGPANEAAPWLEPTRGAIEWGRLIGIALGSRHVLRDAAAILCVGQAEQEAALKRFPDKRVIFLPNGVDVPRFSAGDGARFRAAHGIAPNAFVALAMGRIDDQKNQKFLIRMMPAMLKVQPETHLLLIGPVTNEVYRKELEALIRNVGIENRVTLIPGVDPAGPDLVDAYHSADMLVLPSRHEPFGIVVLEAWASGLPVLASRTGGIPSFVKHGENGLLHNSEDEAEFIEGFTTIATQPEAARRLAAAGADRVSDYSWDKITDMLASIYQDVIREHRSKSKAGRPEVAAIQGKRG